MHVPVITENVSARSSRFSALRVVVHNTVSIIEPSREFMGISNDQDFVSKDSTDVVAASVNFVRQFALATQMDRTANEKIVREQQGDVITVILGLGDRIDVTWLES
jgi:hypothetical protein